MIKTYPPDFSKSDIELIDSIRSYTRSSPERLLALLHAARYTERIPGAIVECGVYRGGSAMLMAKVTTKPLWLYDTFAGMPKPSELDIDIVGTPAMIRFEKEKINDKSSHWLHASKSVVEHNLDFYPNKHLIEGLVEETIPAHMPDQIALLHLDTDFYTSTKHTLEHLYPRLSSGGILIIDDYGLFQGAKKATDEYLDLFLTRIDYSARLAIKP